MSLGSQKEQQSIRQISGQVSRLMENLKKGGTREDPCKVTLHECMHIVPAYVIHACPSTIRQNDIYTALHIPIKLGSIGGSRV